MVRIASSPDSTSRSLGEHFYEFGGFRLYPFKRLLVHDERPVAVTPKVMDTLRVLVANSGRVVTKEELMSEVWADTIVEEGGLTRNISVLRKALGKDKNGHGFIATIPGRGYQFVADVRDVPDVPTGPRAHYIVGRAEQRAALRAGFESVAAGRGLLLCVGGESGIGKTTLVEDFLREVTATGEQCNIASARCSERLTGTGAALPWLEALDSLSRGEALKPTRFDRKSIVGAIRTLAPNWYLQLSHLARTDPERPLVSDVRTASQERLKLELNALLQELTRTQPLILFLDDLHWADASTSDMLTFLVDRLSSLRVLVVAAYRPTDMRMSRHPLLHLKPNWQAHGVCREIPLSFLTRQEVEEYLALEFPNHHFPSSLASLIHRRTEGSPLFVTELVSDFRGRGLVARKQGRWRITQSLAHVEGGLPESIRGMIEGKISQLDENERRLLEKASVQGYDFDSAVLARTLSMNPAEVEEALANLDRVKNFVSFVEQREFPDGTMTLRYRFVHVLYQEALYSQLQPTRVADLSARIADAMLAYWGERSSEVASELAILFEAARNWSRAADFFLLSMRRASRFSAARDAVLMARRGLAALGRLPATAANDALELELQVMLGISLTIIGNWEAGEAETALNRAHELGRNLTDNPNVLAAEWGLIVSHCVRGQYQAARVLAERLLVLAEKTRDPAQVVVAQSALGTIMVQLGELKTGTAHLERALSMYDPNHLSPHPALTAIDFGVRCRCYLARSFWLLGWPDQARRWIQDALDITQEVPTGGVFALAMLTACTVHEFLREAPACRELAESVIRLAEGTERPLDSDSACWAPVALGWALCEDGKPIEGLSLMRESLTAYRSNGRGWIAQSVLFAEELCKAGETEEGLRTVSEVLALIESTGERFYEAELHRVRGELLLRSIADGKSLLDETSEQVSEAEGCFHKGLEIARKQEAKSLELRSAVSLSKLWDKTGKRADARELLAAIYGWFTEGFETKDLQEAKALLAKLTKEEPILECRASAPLSL